MYSNPLRRWTPMALCLLALGGLWAAGPVHADESEEIAIVVFLSDETFDALELDETQTLFGDPELVAAGGVPVSPLGSFVADVDGDGTLDLVVGFSIDEAIFAGAIDVDTGVVQITGIPPSGSPDTGSICITVERGADGKMLEPPLICVPPKRRIPK